MATWWKRYTTTRRWLAGGSRFIRATPPPWIWCRLSSTRWVEMHRNLSPEAIAAFLSQESDEVLFACVRIDHPDLPAPIRLVGNTAPAEREDGFYEPAD